MLKADDLALLQSLVSHITEGLSALPENEELRYAYRLATAHALSLSDQLAEIERLQARLGPVSQVRLAS
ncbi:MAG: hypothetical protein MUF64_14935 [Polyangiaceae bacterium]|jgi:hypothetical protein|nr:hypothetical protein [Polyangiaceae bacterium]